MADDERSSAYRSSPPSHWGQSPHIYPHSSHGTPSQEYGSFNFTSPQIPMEPSAFGGTLHQRPSYQQLQPLMTAMPPWPSMLGQSHSSFQPVFTQPLPPVQPIQPISIGPAQTPVSATSSRSASTPRKTLTDSDRKRMCQWAEEHPNSKQTEIGAIFGVERSTVSKVLRQKDKYLLQDDGSRSPIKRAKGRSPDIERALVNWAKNQMKKGLVVTDDQIRDTARAFAATTTTPENNVPLSASWIEKFKLRHNLMGARSRKASLAPTDDGDTGALSSVSGTHSPPSPHAVQSPSPIELHDSQSQDGLKAESPPEFLEFGSKHSPYHAQSTTSLNSAFADHASSSFSPSALSPTSSFFTSDAGTTPSPYVPAPSIRPILPATTSANAHRPRSQTFPLLDSYMTSADASTTKFGHSAILDSPMEEPTDPLRSISDAISASENPDPRPATVMPAETMRPPPLPAHVLQNDGTKREPTSTSPIQTTTPEEARRAFQVVLSFFEQQPAGYLDLQESLTMGKLMEKLNLQSRGAS